MRHNPITRTISDPREARALRSRVFVRDGHRRAAPAPPSSLASTPTSVFSPSSLFEPQSTHLHMFFYLCFLLFLWRKREKKTHTHITTSILLNEKLERFPQRETRSLARMDEREPFAVERGLGRQAPRAARVGDGPHRHMRGRDGVRRRQGWRRLRRRV